MAPEVFVDRLYMQGNYILRLTSVVMTLVARVVCTLLFLRMSVAFDTPALCAATWFFRL